MVSINTIRTPIASIDLKIRIKAEIANFGFDCSKYGIEVVFTETSILVIIRDTYVPAKGIISTVYTLGDLVGVADTVEPYVVESSVLWFKNLLNGYVNS